MERESTPNNKASSEDGKDRTKDAGHFKHKPGIWIKDYKVIAHLGDGTFGRVLEVKDRETSKLYAMKVIRAVDRYIDSAKTETEILTYLKKNDPEDKYHIVKLKSAFDFEKNYCMVFEKLGMSLYDFLKKNNYRGFKIDYIRSFTKQILEAVGFMHQVGLTHTDLKPENILLVNDESIPIKERGSSEDSPRLERSSTCSTSQEKVYYLPKDDRVKIIDMGGATYDHEHHSSVINTRQYRAPEVILGCCQWDHQSDVWSIGCIILELFSGELFFETHESYEHLAMIDKAVGPIPYWMSNRADSETRKYFICSEEYFEQNGTYLDWPKSASSEESVQHVKNLKGINDIIPSHFPELIDLLEKMLVIDPNKRIKCWDALEHPFFKKIGKSGL
jgi:serine/threonine protein kinase